MRYSKQINLAFLHYPKTGGNSIYIWYDTQQIDKIEIVVSNPHEPLSNKITSPNFTNWKDVNIFTIIRNPLAMVLSTYIYWKRFPTHLNYNAKIANQLNFNEFVTPAMYMLHSYKEFITINNEIPSNVSIVRLEDMNTIGKNVINGLIQDKRIHFEPLHTNKTNHKPYMEYYNKRSISLVQQKFKWVYDMGFYNI